MFPIEPLQFTCAVVPTVLSETIVLRRLTVPLVRAMPPPPVPAVLWLTVALMTVVIAPSICVPPPVPAAELLVKVTLIDVPPAAVQMPPPSRTPDPLGDELPLTVELVRFSVPPEV